MTINLIALKEPPFRDATFMSPFYLRARVLKLLFRVRVLDAFSGIIRLLAGHTLKRERQRMNLSGINLTGLRDLSGL